MLNRNAESGVWNGKRRIFPHTLYGKAFAAFIVAAFVMTSVLFPSGAAAQQNNVIAKKGIQNKQRNKQLYFGLMESLLKNKKLKEPDVAIGDFDSLFFTVWQHALLQESKKGFTARLPGDFELLEDNDDLLERDRGLRELSLGGIVYTTPQDWTVWLNGNRVTPDAIPEEILDIVVKKNYINLKWFDSYTNLIYPVRLRAHQRFNLDTRIFLPGTGTL